MKILILSGAFPPISNGGAEKIAFNLAKGFQRLGNQVYVITTVQDKSKAGKIDYRGLTIFQIYADYSQHWQSYLELYNPQTVNRVRAIIKRIQPDITHIHVVHHYLSYYCLKIAKKYSQAVFLTAHDVMPFHYGKLFEFINPDKPTSDFNYRINPWQQIKRFKKRYNPFRNIIIKHYLKYVDKIFAVSYALKDSLLQNGIKNIEVIHNGINADEWRIDGKKVEEFKKKHNLFDKKVILFAGRLNALKGGEKIIESMKKVIKRMPETTLLVAGKKDNYTRRMLKKNILLVLTGWIEGDELKSAYQCSDIVVTPSIYLDPFPTVNLEAMACKKPVIGTCFGGTPEIVVNNKTGYIVNPYKTEELANKILDLLANPEKAIKFGENGFQRVKESFSAEKQLAEILKWYKKYA